MLEIIFIIKFILALFILATSFLGYVLKTLRNQKNNKTAYIVVLGDIERSPRMKYHCLSLVREGYNVKLIGYTETKLMDQIGKNPAISVASLRPYPKALQVGPKIAQYCLKTFYLSVDLFFVLVRQRPVPKFVLVQNPPSIPTLGLVYLYCFLSDSRFVIDWHNYGFTILALTNGPKNILVKICRKFELFFGAKADFNLCVTSAMKKDLESHNINAFVMYDKAHERFHQLSLEERHDFYLRLVDHYKLNSLKNDVKVYNNIFTKMSDGNIELVPNRPAIVVSSSSWTEDEDFHLLIDAFEIYQRKISEEKATNLPNIVCLLTGKGPLKEYYENKFKAKNFKNIQVFFLWLDSDDYPRLLGSSDLGVSFHKSSSNLDLPMKVVDMFGARLPVCALHFSCIDELVKKDENGLLFTTGSELATQFCELLPTIDKKDSKLQKFRDNLKSFSNWDEEWSNKFKPILENLI